MTETLTPERAADILLDAAGFERALERRTEGLTMMAWGIVSSAIFVTYGFASVLGADAAPWVYSVLWIPWVGAGIAMTFALWRSAALSRPRPLVDKEDVKGYWLRTIGLTLFITAIFAFVRPDGPTLPLAILGAVWALVAVVNLFRSHPEERRVAFAAGVLLLGVAVALMATRAPIDVSGTVSSLAPLVVMGGLGLWQTLRG